MRFSLIALFLLSLIVAVASGFRLSMPRIPKIPKFDSLPRFHEHPTLNRNVYGSPGLHSYPDSSGLSGYSYSGNVHNIKPKTGLGVDPFDRLPRYRDSSTAKPYYSANRGSGGTHSYSASSGLSGNRNMQPTYHQQPSPRTEVHHHYFYNPPQRIKYGLTYHPVYQGQPPRYVYEYQNSGSRFDTLLTGLALYNLGRNSNSHRYNSDRQYTSSSGEICKLHISEGPVNYEETRIDCNLMSSFIWDDTMSKLNEQSTINTAVKDALNLKGPSIQVTPDMTCSLIRTFGDTTTMRKSVNCELLQEYARSSLQRNVAQCLTPQNTAIILHFLFIIYWLRNIML